MKSVMPHERWDGTGYPHGLSGDSIPQLARILTLVGAYDTILEDRSYRKALGDAQAVREIMQAAGKQFDPELAYIFVEKVLGKMPKYLGSCRLTLG